jgi:hypothetical protein
VPKAYEEYLAPTALVGTDGMLRSIDNRGIHRVTLNSIDVDEQSVAWVETDWYRLSDSYHNFTSQNTLPEKREKQNKPRIAWLILNF